MLRYFNKEILNNTKKVFELDFSSYHTKHTHARHYTTHTSLQYIICIALHTTPHTTIAFALHYITYACHVLFDDALHVVY